MKEVMDIRRFKQKMLSLKQCLRLCPKALIHTKVLMMQSQVPFLAVTAHLLPINFYWKTCTIIRIYQIKYY